MASYFSVMKRQSLIKAYSKVTTKFQIGLIAFQLLKRREERKVSKLVA